MQTSRIRLERVPAAVAGLAIVVAGLVLAGWTWNIDPLKRILPGLVSMNPMTAVAFVLAGVSLWLQHAPAAASASATRGRRVARLAAAAVVVIGLLRLAAVAFGWDAGVDQRLFGDQLAGDNPAFPNRMAPNTALNFVLLGLALVTLDVTSRGGRRPAEWLASVVFLISLLALTGYAYRVPEFAEVANFIPMALHTAGVFLLLALGVFVARPGSGMMAVITGPGPGGAMARRLLPGMVLALLALGWLRLEGERRGFYGAGLGEALYTVTIIVVFGALIGWSARSLHRAEAERARLAERQRDSDERIRLLLDSTAEAIYGLDADGRCTFINQACVRMLGYADSRALLGRDMHGLIHSLRPDGTPYPVEACPIYRAIRTSTPVHVDDEMFWRADGTGFAVEYWSHPMHRHGKLVGAVVTFLDISERRQAEQAILALNAELQQSNRELEAFSYTISHDLRAPLRHIGGYARMLHEDAGAQLDADMRRYLDTISDAARQMGALIDDLLAFSKLGRKPVERTEVDMGALVGRVVQEMGAGDDGRVSVGPLPAVRADPVLFRQVWVNLLSNALKYSAPRGDAARIEISGERVGQHARYRVCDNGVGFDMRYADKLFGVFQRLHSQDAFEGTGVGLAIVQRIVIRHGGTIAAESELGHGATFTFELPIGEEPAPPEAPATEAST